MGLLESERKQPKPSRCALSQQGEERKTHGKGAQQDTERGETERGVGSNHRAPLSGLRQLVENFPRSGCPSQKQLEVEKRGEGGESGECEREKPTGRMRIEKMGERRWERKKKRQRAGV